MGRDALPLVNVRVPDRFLALLDKVAANNKVTRSSLLTQIFVLGLRDYAELQKLAAHVVAGDYALQECSHQ
jgi:hypothetical protein